MITHYLGIDGGGTKTTFLLVDINGNEVKKLRLGPSNPIDLGIDNCLKILKEGIENIIENIEYSNISVFAGISGGTTGDSKNQIAKFLGEFGFGYYNNGSDAENIIKAGLKEDDGIIVITGTGCCAFSKSNDVIKRYGGLGWRFDRYGGGYDYGNLALRAAMMAEDGTGKQTLIRNYVLEKTGHKTVLEDLAYFYTLKKDGIANFATTIFEAYKKGDVVATEIIEESIEYIANLIISATSTAPKINGKYKVIFVGGLTKDFSLIKPCLLNKLSKIKDEKLFNLCVYNNDVVYGALYLAGLKYKETI